MKKIWKLIKWQLFMDDNSLSKVGTEEDPLQQAVNIVPYIFLLGILSVIYSQWESIKVYILDLP